MKFEDLKGNEIKEEELEDMFWGVDFLKNYQLKEGKFVLAVDLLLDQIEEKYKSIIIVPTV